MVDLRAQLRELFGLEDFRPAQREVIEEVLAGKDVLCVMPTGAGKSLCYQLPAAVGGGLSIVVSPLISLMQDQVQQLHDEGLAAAFINSTQNSSQQGDVRKMLGEPPTIALTATATDDVRGEIVEKLGLRRPKIFITGFDRPNLR